jgi:archaeosine synthase
MAGLGRTVLARHRMARLWGLGDRSSLASKTPGLVLSSNEEMDVEWAPFFTSNDGAIPRNITLESRAPFAPWENPTNGPKLSASIGHVLPPSLDEADAGEVASKGDLLPISWQSLNHDEELLDPDLNPHVVVLTDALQLANRPGRLVEAIHVIKRKFPGALLWAPGIGGPDNCAVLAWFGIDLFDTTRSKQAESHGAVLTWNGPRMRTTNEPEINHWVAAIAETRSAISSQSLRELAQSQSLSSPRLVEHMRYNDILISKGEGVLSQIVESSAALRVHSVESHSDPLIMDWVQFMTEEYVSPQGLDNILVLLPCSARKPYSYSRSHKSFHRAMNHNAAHEVMVTSPLGLVPRDLEEVWPAGHYDIPVTGDWTTDERIRVTKMIDALVSRNNYRLIINHSGMDYHSETPVIDTRQGDSATYHAALDRLGQAMLDNMRVKRRSGERTNLDNFRSVARLHHLNDAWLSGVEIRGRFPRWKILRDGEQIAMWAPERGGFSLSKAGISILDSQNSLKRIHLKPNVKWKGDVNLVILESYDFSIRSGEDVLVMQGSQCIGSARASAPAWEWEGTPGRLAKMHQRL